MDLHNIIFFFLAVMSISCALGVILSRNPINSVLFLIATFFSISGHYILMNAQFLGVVNVIVYAGAIMVLFLFVIMLMNLNADVEPQKNWLLQLAGAVSGGVLFLVVLASLVKTIDLPAVDKSPSDIGLIKRLGQVLFTDFVFPFEIAGVLFLSAMIGAIVIGKKEQSIEVPLQKDGSFGAKTQETVLAKD